MNKKVLQYIALAVLFLILWSADKISNQKEQELRAAFFDDEIISLIIKEEGQSILLPDIEAKKCLAAIRNFKALESHSAGAWDYMIDMRADGINHNYWLRVAKYKYDRYFYVNLSFLSGRNTHTYLAYDDADVLNEILGPYYAVPPQNSPEELTSEN